MPPVEVIPVSDQDSQLEELEEPDTGDTSEEELQDYDSDDESVAPRQTVTPVDEPWSADQAPSAHDQNLPGTPIDQENVNNNAQSDETPPEPQYKASITNNGVMIIIQKFWLLWCNNYIVEILATAVVVPVLSLSCCRNLGNCRGGVST